LLSAQQARNNSDGESRLQNSCAVDYTQLLLEHLDLVDRLVHYIARRHHLSAVDTEEFSSLVRFKLIDRDFAILRKFQGRSTLATFLTTVLERQYLDFCTAQWGKWRPSAIAGRLGPVAVLLERLLVREGFSFSEAVAVLQTNHGVSATDEDLYGIYEQLPGRSAPRSKTNDALAPGRAGVGIADPELERHSDLQTAQRIEHALSTAVSALSPREQLIIRLRFQDDLSIADIARLLHIPSKPLYRQLHDIIGLLRTRLDQDGINPADISRIVGHSAITLGRILAEPSTTL